jgi:hypothetical protein
MEDLIAFFNGEVVLIGENEVAEDDSKVVQRGSGHEMG